MIPSSRYDAAIRPLFDSLGLKYIDKIIDIDTKVIVYKSQIPKWPSSCIFAISFHYKKPLSRKSH